ncbi:MAG: ABC transporter substrate-binding protein [Actinobacteria bacterium]|nr:ABC transporter substrate-binding protein [Actinomycetota bacterium]
MSMRRARAFVAAFALLLAACDPAAPASTGELADARSSASRTDGAAEAGGTLRWAVREPAAVVPAGAVDDASLLIVDTLFDSLTALALDGTVRPRAAVRWTPSDGGRRWQFTLRRGARYHDGTPVRARDFVRSWSLTVAQGHTGAHLEEVVGYRDVREGRASQLAGVRALDRRTLEVQLRRPHMGFPTVAAHPTLAPVPAAAASARDRYAKQPIGNGPYRMSEPLTTGQFIRVKRDDEWHNGPRDRSDDRVREVLFRIIDADAAYVAFQQGRIDVSQLPAGALDQALRTYGPADGSGGPGVVDAPRPSLYFLGLRVDRAPLDDVEVRRALSLAIDRRALVDDQGDLALDPARGIMPPVLPRGDELVCATCLHLPSLAAAAFARAGVNKMTLTIDADGGHEQVAERIRADLAAVGVDLVVRVLPFEEYLAEVESGAAELYRFGWQASRPTAGAMLEAIVRSGPPEERGDGANYGGYASDTVDALLDRARRAEAEERRDRLWARAEQRALDDQAIIPLFSFRQRIVISDRVAGLVVTPWGTATPERASIVAGPDIAP